VKGILVILKLFEGEESFTFGKKKPSSEEMEKHMYVM
jgi:hypothetical protein